MPFVVLDDHFDEHPKVVRVGGDAAWLHVCAVLYCRRHLTNGVFSKVLVPRLSDRKQPMKLASRLVAEGLWEDRGENYEIHDYVEFYEHEDYQRAQRVERAKRAARARWDPAKDDPPGIALGNAQASPEQSASNASGTTEGNAQPMPSPSPSPLRDDLSQLLTHVGGADRGQNHGDSLSLRERLEMVCTGESAVRRRQSAKVLELCRRYVSDVVIDEAIGYLGTLRQPPEYPVYLLKVISQWGPQRGAEVPDLTAMWEQGKRVSSDR